MTDKLELFILDGNHVRDRETKAVVPTYSEYILQNVPAVGYYNYNATTGKMIIAVNPDTGYYQKLNVAGNNMPDYATDIDVDAYIRTTEFLPKKNFVTMLASTTVYLKSALTKCMSRVNSVLQESFLTWTVFEENSNVVDTASQQQSKMYLYDPDVNLFPSGSTDEARLNGTRNFVVMEAPAVTKQSTSFSIMMSMKNDGSIFDLVCETTPNEEKDGQ